MISEAAKGLSKYISNREDEIRLKNAMQFAKDSSPNIPESYSRHIKAGVNSKANRYEVVANLSQKVSEALGAGATALHQMATDTYPNQDTFCTIDGDNVITAIEQFIDRTGQTIGEVLNTLGDEKAKEANSDLLFMLESAGELLQKKLMPAIKRGFTGRATH